MEEEKKKLNVTFLIGNGFDMGILGALGQKHKTSYPEFYDYLTYYLWNKDNFIYEELQKLQRSGKDEWKDFELVLKKAIEKKLGMANLEKADKKDDISGTELTDEKYDQVLLDWEEIQYLFADFLNHVITPEIYKKASHIEGQTITEKFLGDLKDNGWENIKFRNRIDHDTKLNYNFLNFNYSALLDNYLYQLFDYHPYKISENNSGFYPRPWKEGYYAKGGRYSMENGSFSVEVETSIYHPHGNVAVPSSLLFGVCLNKAYEISKTDSGTSGYRKQEIRKRMDKSYWSQAEKVYQPIIENTDLFVIYGLSMGKSDAWWWKSIGKKLSESESEAIIYHYGEYSYREKTLKEVLERYVAATPSDDKIFEINFDERAPLQYAFNFKQDNKKDEDST